MMIDNSKAFLLFLALLRCCFESFCVRVTMLLRWSFCLCRNLFLSILSFELSKMENVYSFTPAVHGFHYYRKFWKPKENEKLDCSHEEHNPFDWFAIKTVTSDGMIVGHLPREISRITKFFLDRGAVMQVELTSKYYRRFPLVKGGMEIACLVRVRIPATLKNIKLAEKYL